MPLSPTRYNGLPPALDSELQQQFIQDISPSSYDVTGITPSLLGEGDPISSSRFYIQNRLDPVYPGFFSDHHESVTMHSQSRDFDHVISGSYPHIDSVVEVTSFTPRPDDVMASKRTEQCSYECDTATENTGQVTYGSDTSKNSVLSSTDFRTFSSQFPHTQLQPEFQHEINSVDRDIPLVSSNHLLRDAVDVDLSGKSLSCSSNVSAFGTSHHNAAVSLFQVDTVSDPLVSVATSLVNFAFNSAVRIMQNDVTVTSEPNPVAEVVVSSASNSAEPLSTSDESIKDSEDPVEAAAKILVSQVLSAVLQKNSGSVVTSTKTFPAETPITSVAPVQCAPSPSSCYASAGELTADNNLEGDATSNAAGALMPAAAADDYHSYSVRATESTEVDAYHVLAAQDLVRVLNDDDCTSLYAVGDDYESMMSSYDGRLTFVAEDWRPVSPPFTDTCSPENASELLNSNSVIVQLFDDVDAHQRDSDYSSSHHSLNHVNPDAPSRIMHSETTPERRIELSGNDADNTAETFADNWIPDADNYSDIQSPLEQPLSENMVVETWSFYRPEDYFFHRYVIPVEQLEATSTTDSDVASDVKTVQVDRDDQRSKMQLDLKTDEENVEADIEAVAAFCRAMFTTVETDTDDDERRRASDVDSSPDGLDEYTRCGRPAGVRRSISLRTSPKTPQKKKSVRFADALGLDLEYVRQFQSSVEDLLPTISSDDDVCRPRRPLLAEASAAWRRSRQPARRYLCACFQAPYSHPDFIERVRQSRVVLESCDADDREMTISGVVRVANVAYRKVIAARVTTDGWATQTDVSADYVPRSNDGTTDRFSFQIVLPRGATDVGRRVEFAVYFTAFFDSENRSETYWDNNFGANYCFECYAHDDSGTLSLETEMDNDDSHFSSWLRFDLSS